MRSVKKKSANSICRTLKKMRFKPRKVFEPEFSTGSHVGEGRPDVVARLCMVVDWCIDHPEYTAKIKVIPKKDYPVLMPCEF